jgi:hypothetical protein
MASQTRELQAGEPGGPIMLLTSRNACRILALSLVLAIPACGGSDSQSPSGPQSSANTSSISGTVVYDQTGSPAVGVDVLFEMQTGSMMMGDHWEQTAHMMSDAHGQFHFEYMHDAMHRYRVGVAGMTDRHMCDSDGGHEDGLVLRIPSQTP